MPLVTLRRRIGDLKPSFDDLLSSDYRNHPRYRDVIGHWILNESGGLTAYDISGNGNHGTLTNGPVWTQGQFGPALSFDGTDDYVSIPDNASLRFSATDSTFTFAAWVYATAEPYATGAVITKWIGATSERAYLFGRNNVDNIVFMISTNGTGAAMTLTSTSGTIPLNQWTHIVVTGNIGTDVFLTYINGVSVSNTGSTAISSIFNGAGNVNIGTTKNGLDDIFAGQIDDVRIYNRALSAAEVMSLYADPFLEFQRLEFYRWIRRIVTPESIIPVLTTPPVYRPTLIGARTI